MLWNILRLESKKAFRRRLFWVVSRSAAITISSLILFMLAKELPLTALSY